MQKKRFCELAFIATLSFAIVFIVLCVTGTIDSGYHFVDDHEFLEYRFISSNHLTSASELVKQWVQYDINRGRFRPLYYASRVLLTYVLGTNLVLWSILRGIVVSLSLIFLYYCGKNICGSKTSSYLFALVSMVGFQSAVWWKLGPQEDFATLLFATGFLCELVWLKNRKKGYAIGSIIIFLLMANYKESYIILLPFIAAYVIYDTFIDCDTVAEMKSEKTRLNGRRAYIWMSMIMFLVMILIVLSQVGLNSISESSEGGQSKIALCLSALKNEFATDLRWYKLTGIILIAILLTYWEKLKRLWKEIILTLVFLLPQFAIYAESGLTERYILPASVGFAMFFLLFISRAKMLCGKRKALYYAIIAMLLLLNGRSMLVEADYFRYRGNSIQTMMEESEKLMTNDDIKLVSCFSPNEESNITLKYWMLFHGIDQVYYYHEDTHKIDKEFQFDKYQQYTDSNDTELNIADADIVVMYNKDDRHYNHEPTINLSGFRMVKCGTLTMYIRDGAGLKISAITIKPSRYYR